MTELSSSFRHAWDAFRSATSVRLLQETLEWEWSRGRKEYAAFLVEIEDDAVRKHIARTIDAIADIPGVDPYPPTYWHVTIKSVGFVVDNPGRPDEVSPAALDGLAQRAGALIGTVPAFSASAGLPSAFPEVVMLEVSDAGSMRLLNERLTSDLPGVPLHDVDTAAYLPHISIARFRSSEGLPALKEHLTRLRETSERGPDFSVNTVRLIQAHLAEEAPTFDVLASYALGS
jgi:2'-5' RNA ligase